MASTWHAVGGVGLPTDASSSEQTYRAQLLYNRSGAGAVAGLRPLPVHADACRRWPTRTPPSSGRPRSVRSRPRLGVRPTKTLGQNFVIDANTVRRIVRAAGLDRRRRRPRGRARARLADPRRCCRRPPASSPSRSTRCWPPRCRRRSRRTPRRWPTAARWSPPTRCGRRPCPAPPPDRAGRQPALQRLRAGAAAPAGRCCPSLRARAGDGAGRGRRPAGRRARARKVYGVPSSRPRWYADVRRAGAVGRNVFWPAPNVDSGLVALDPPRAAGRPRRPASRSSRSSTRRSPSAARRCAARWRGWAGSADGRRGGPGAAGVDPLARGESLTSREFARIAERALATRRRDR